MVLITSALNECPILLVSFSFVSQALINFLSQALIKPYFTSHSKVTVTASRVVGHQSLGSNSVNNSLLRPAALRACARRCD
jgi:hypothetical protein